MLERMIDLTWLDEQPLKGVLATTTLVCGLAGVLAWMKANGNKWPPPNVLFVAFTTSGLTGLIAFLWLAPDFEGPVAKLLAVCLAAGLTGSSGLELVVRFFRGTTFIQKAPEDDKKA